MKYPTIGLVVLSLISILAAAGFLFARGRIVYRGNDSTEEAANRAALGYYHTSALVLFEAPPAPSTYYLSIPTVQSDGTATSDPDTDQWILATVRSVGRFAYVQFDILDAKERQQAIAWTEEPIKEKKPVVKVVDQIAASL